MNYFLQKSCSGLLIAIALMSTGLTRTSHHHFAPEIATINDSVKGKSAMIARRDEYFKDVQIIVDDKPANVFFNKPYEKLTDREKDHYLSNVPEKEKVKGIPESDFSSFTSDEGAKYYLDNKETTREAILKKPREYYACGGFKRSGNDKRYYFYTFPHFEKHIKHLKDHYPEKEYKLTVLNEVREYIMPDQPPVPKKETYEREGRANDGEQYAVVSYMSYAYTDETGILEKEIMAHFPGGKDKFTEYLFGNIKVPYDLSGQELRIDFTINTDGSLSEISMADSTDPVLGAEVQRVMTASPRWIPSQKKGIPQPVGTRDYFKNNKPTKP